MVPELEIYNIILRKHGDIEYSGQKKIYRTIATEYYGIRSVEVKWLLDYCRVCKEKAASTIKPPLNVIISSAPFNRI